MGMEGGRGDAMGGADMKLALIAVKKSCARRSKDKKSPTTGRYLQMLFRDEMRSLSTLSVTRLPNCSRRQGGTRAGAGGEISSVPVAAAAKQLEWMLIPRRVCTP